MDRLDAMHIFVVVADQRGFAPAARRLKLSPSVVTRGIAALEERLGARLLQRTTRSVKLTDAGARFLEQTRSILAAVSEAEGSAKVEATIPSGRFMVSAPRVFGRVHVAPLMHAFLAKYQAVTAELFAVRSPRQPGGGRDRHCGSHRCAGRLEPRIEGWSERPGASSWHLPAICSGASCLAASRTSRSTTSST
jgi:DNA-binding transcriptional LysR family regulator